MNHELTVDVSTGELIPAGDVLQNGRDALDRVQIVGKKLRDDWLIIATALNVGKVMYTTENNTLNKKGFGQWCDKEGFGSIERRERHAALWMLDNWDSNVILYDIRIGTNLNNPVSLYNECNERMKDDKYSDVAKRIQEFEVKTGHELNVESASRFNCESGDVYLINGKHKVIVGDATTQEIKKLVGAVDCVMTDPPYGISYKSPSGSGLAQRGDYAVIEGDDVEFDPSILFEYSPNVITWGANHYADKLSNSAGWIVWDKREGEQVNNNSDCELAWTNMLNSARMFHHKWNGMIKASERGESRIHPTQKPIKLFMYCLEMCRAGNVVLDMYAGSGTTLFACEETNRAAILVELVPSYCAAMLNRFELAGMEVVKL